MYSIEPRCETDGISERDRWIILMSASVSMEDMPRFLSMFGYDMEPDGTIRLTPAVGRKSGGQNDLRFQRA